MKRILCQLSLLAAATAAAPAVLAGNDIVKCIDSAGHVTLTDQPCGDGTTTVRMANMPAAEGVSTAQPYPLTVERSSVPPARAAERKAPRRAKAKPMQRDVATLKEARAQFLLLDSGAKHTLAGLQ
ncbi:DUF4124 domain-containing protein [Massilia sp. ST3]|uniref:DUF4124 domain-containing protein n=1 Tax=Massilia sp. ST3 TaxID=2824903 RepID=UPI001B814318|nr:DUF4124 domain-containing protein [Massilia sp. ST3]MBQ5949858.1 DUF4124 domain-containing protein [Massilia sp. ST3]